MERGRSMKENKNEIKEIKSRGRKKEKKMKQGKNRDE